MTGHRYLLGLFVLAAAALAASLAQAQQFGKNKVRYEQFDFRVVETEHFDIHYYEALEPSIDEVARLAERWYYRLSDVLDHEFRRRQPLIIYATHTHFRQTNTTLSQIGEGTGGFTEPLKNRVVMPMSGTLGDFDHVLGHELVHAFQFSMTGSRGDSTGSRIPGATRLPLWLVEGMAEYLSVGPVDSHTAMWLRDAVRREELPSLNRLNRPRYNPYRYGQAFMSYIAGRWGDDVVQRFLRTAVEAGNLQRAVQQTFDMSVEELSEQWHEALRNHYQPMIEAAGEDDALGRMLLPGTEEDSDRRNRHIAPALSPDGEQVVYFSERENVPSLELYLADVSTGEEIRRLSEFALEPHLESLQFIDSAGTWHPDGNRFALATVSSGEPTLTILDTSTGETVNTVEFSELGEIYNPAWSPDGRYIAFSGQLRGFTDLYVYDLQQGELERLTDDVYSALQPAWSPDGGTIAYVTDRFTTDLQQLASGRPRIGLYRLDRGEIGLDYITQLYAGDAGWYCSSTRPSRETWSMTSGVSSSV